MVQCPAHVQVSMRGLKPDPFDESGNRAGPRESFALAGANPNTIDTEDCRKGLSLAMPKEKIHPNYAAVKVMCACGNNFETRSTHKGDIHVEICSNCHPFFTGKQRLVDTAGRVERFRRKYAKAGETSPAK